MNYHTEYELLNIKHEMDPLSAIDIKIEPQDIESDVNTRQVNIKQEIQPSEVVSCNYTMSKDIESDVNSSQVNIKQEIEPSEVVSCVSTVCKLEVTKENMNRQLEDYQKRIEVEQENTEKDETILLYVRDESSKIYAQEEKYDMHIGDKACMCILCKTSLLKHNDLSTDRSTNISDKNFKCHNSRISCNNLHNISTDSHIHKDKFFKCSICKKSFSRKHDLVRHLNIHKGEKPYICNFCSKSFFRKSNLTEHMLTHTGEKPFTCECCKRSFSLKQSLVRHSRTHTDEKPYICNFCSKSFFRKSYLIVHMNTHLGEKTFVCLFCGKSFSRKSQLVDHTRIHTNE